MSGENKIEIGDLVSISGYDDEVFIVIRSLYNVLLRSTIYECESIDSNKFILAFDYQLNSIDFDNLDDFIKYDANKTQSRSFYPDPTKEKVCDAYSEEVDYVKEDADRVDELLIELYDIISMIKNHGEHEDDEKKDEKYAIRKKEIEEELKELTG